MSELPAKARATLRAALADNARDGGVPVNIYYHVLDDIQAVARKIADVQLQKNHGRTVELIGGFAFIASLIIAFCSAVPALNDIMGGVDPASTVMLGSYIAAGCIFAGMGVSGATELAREALLHALYPLRDELHEGESRLIILTKPDYNVISFKKKKRT